MALTALAAPARGQTVVVGVGGALSALPLDTFRIPIYADLTAAGGEKLGSYTVRVSWNPAIMRYISFEQGSFAQATVRADSAFSFGVFWATAVAPGGSDGIVELFRLRMRSDTGGTGSVNVQVTEASAAGTLTNLLPFVTAVTGTFCTAVGRWGDLDGDRFANSRDALAILSDAVDLAVDPAFDLSLADVDGDGVGNTRDALILLSYAVGLEISGHRVLLTAPGPCASPTQQSVVVVPDTADLVVGQSVTLSGQVRDASGRLVTVTGLNWAVRDRRVAVVSTLGVLTALDTGTTVVEAAVGPGIRLAVPVISRARRAVWYVNGPVASQRTVQLGTMSWPLSTPQRAFRYLREGDTVRVAPGIHEYENLGDDLEVGAVFIGDTLPDGTRPILRSAPSLYLTALPWEGGLRGEVRNLEFHHFYQIGYISGLRNLILDNVRTSESSYTYYYGYGIQVYEPLDTLIVTRSDFVADSTAYSESAISVYNGARFISISDSRFTRWGYYALFFEDIDSLDIRRNVIDSSYYGVYVEDDYDGTGATALVQNRFLHTTSNYYSLQSYGVGRTWLDGNYYDQRQYGPAYIYGPSSDHTAGKLTIRRDTVDMYSTGYPWLQAYDLDSIVVDSVEWRNPRDTLGNNYADLEARHVVVRRSRLGISNGSGLRTYSQTTVVDSTAFLGCSICTWNTGYGIQAYGLSGYSGPAVTVRNSTFSRVVYAFYSPVSASRSGPMVLTGNAVDSVGYGFLFYGDSALITDNVMTRVQYQAVQAQPSYSGSPYRAVVLQRNSLTCSVTGATSYGILWYYTSAVVEDNAVRNCDYGIHGVHSASYDSATVTILRDTVFPDVGGSGVYGIRLDGGPWKQASISQNRVQRGAYGIYMNGYGAGTMAMDSNAVSATTNTAILLTNAAFAVSGRKNNVENNVHGIVNAGAYTRSFTLGRFVGNTGWAVSSTPAIDVTQNWWGSSTGATTTQPNGVTGAGVNASNHLTNDPTDVPPASPPAASAPMRGFLPGRRD
jgi:hypothetical protein